MTANVTFVYAERKDVLRIPSAALRFRPPEELLAAGVGKASGGGGKKKKNKAALASPSSSSSSPSSSSGTKTVWAVDGDKLREVKVEIGVSDGNKVEVRQGALGEGDVLITDAIAKNEPGGKNKNKGLF